MSGAIMNKIWGAFGMDANIIKYYATEIGKILKEAK